MRLKILTAVFLLGCAILPAQRPRIVRDVRASLNRGDFAAAKALLDSSAEKDSGWLEALSWMARGHLAAGHADEAERYAAETRERVLAVLKQARLEGDSSLQLALGASIEVQAQVLNARGQKSEAVAFLQAELARWYKSDIRTRIQKNLHLVSLEGKPAPAIDLSSYLGGQPPALQSLRGRKVVLFFWAHWCGDCKEQAPILARLAREIPRSRLTIIGPTQPYGYVAGGQEAPRETELQYIDSIRRQHFSSVDGMTVPVSEENFRAWGASTTPTLVVINEAGIVQLYHPGKLTYEQLRAEAGG